MSAAFGDIHFAADNWLYVTLAGFIEKICGGKQISVVGNRHGWHFLAGCFVQQLAGLASSIKQAEISVNVQVNEFWLPHEP